MRKETIMGGGSRASVAGPDSVGRGAGAPVYLTLHGLVVSLYRDSYPPARSIFNTTGSYIRVGMRE